MIISFNIDTFIIQNIIQIKFTTTLSSVCFETIVRDCRDNERKTAEKARLTFNRNP